MSRLAKLRENLAAEFDRAEAISAVAADAKRDLTAEEKAQIDAIMGSGKKGEANYKPGTLDAIQADIEREEKIEAKAEELRARRQVLPVQSGDEVKATKKTLPAHVKRHAQLKAFRGENADYNAYAAGQFYAATLFGNVAARKWCQEHGILNATQVESTDTLGGVLVPEETERSIIDLREERGVFRRNARIEPMISDVKSIPRRSGGLTTYFVSEGGSITTSNLTFNQVKLTLRTLAGLVAMSVQLDSDAVVNMGDRITEELGYSFADKEDSCGFLGDATSAYGGIMGLKNVLAAGSVYTAATGNTSFDTMDLTDFENMVAKCPQYPGLRPKWYIHSAGWAASMLRLAEAAGGNSVANVVGGVVKQFLGYPVEFAQVMNSTLTAQTSTAGLCYFGDLAMAAAFGTKGGVMVDVDKSYGFNQALIYIRGMERFDIVVHEIGTASAAGPIVRLDTPAS